jgi:hypothetical protein
MPPQVLSPRGRDRHECSASRLMVALDEAEVGRVLPNGEARARGSPRIEGLGVGPLAGADPLEQIKDQVVDGLGHGNSSLDAAGLDLERTHILQ